MMNKYLKICILLFCLLSSVCPIQAQTGIEREKMTLPLLEVTKEKFVFDLDALITEKIKKRVNIIYQLSIHKDSIYNLYLITLNSYPPESLNQSNVFGAFYVNNTPIVVSKGCNPYELFRITDSSVDMIYYENKIIAKEEFPSWYYLYDGVKLFFIDLPSFYIDRLGFVPCL
ncbi:MAG: hypothetical protein E6767_20615 [Dysgonomonas sp.]|nr:hypothetical protein [Dysgonomonas sp.]